MIREFVRRVIYCINPFKIHAHTPEQIYTPERRPSEIYSSRRTKIYNYNLFEKILERKLQELENKKYNDFV